jgi:hypothetical protein
MSDMSTTDTNHDNLAARIDRLESIVAINRLIGDYNPAVDGKDRDLFVDLSPPAAGGTSPATWPPARTSWSSSLRVCGTAFLSRITARATSASARGTPRPR